jgi:hypothetical protein
MLVATAVIPQNDLVRLVDSITPMRVAIDEERGRVITLGRPKLELVPNQGLRLRGDARVSWDFAHVPVPVTIRAWQLLVVPRVRVRDGSHVLAFEAVLEDLDVKSVPGFVDQKVADAIQRVVAQSRERLAWNFVRTLSKRLRLPTTISPTSTFAIFPVSGKASVGENELRLVLQFEARFELEARLEVEEQVEQRPVPEPEVPAEVETEAPRGPVSIGLTARVPLAVDRRRLPRRRFGAPVRSRTMRRAPPLRGRRIA